MKKVCTNRQAENAIRLGENTIQFSGADLEARTVGYELGGIEITQASTESYYKKQEKK